MRLCLLNMWPPQTGHFLRLQQSGADLKLMGYSTLNASSTGKLYISSIAFHSQQPSSPSPVTRSQVGQDITLGPSLYKSCAWTICGMQMCLLGKACHQIACQTSLEFGSWRMLNLHSTAAVCACRAHHVDSGCDGRIQQVLLVWGQAGICDCPAQVPGMHILA